MIPHRVCHALYGITDKTLHTFCSVPRQPGPYCRALLACESSDNEYASMYIHIRSHERRLQFPRSLIHQPTTTLLAVAAGRKHGESLPALRELHSLFIITCSFLCFPATIAKCRFHLSAQTLPALLHGPTILPYSSASSSR